MSEQQAMTLHRQEESGRTWEVFHARAMYFGYYLAIGSFLPFVNLYFQDIGLNGQQIGLLAALPVFVSTSTSLLWGGIADVLRLHRAILRGALLLAPLLVLVLSRVVEFRTLILLIAVYAFFLTPILPLIDSAALEVASHHQRTYGNLRVWGTIGWSVATLLVGLLIDLTDIHWAFYAYAASLGLTFVLSLFQTPRRQSLRAPLRHGLRQLALRWRFVVFLLSIFLVAATASATMTFFSLFMKEIGASMALIGLAQTVAALSEIPPIALSGAILRRIGARGMLLIACATYVVRWLLLSFVTQPLWALLTQLLHGLSFGAFLIGGVTYVNQRTPEGMSSTAQALYSTVSFGLASIVGSLVGGLLYNPGDFTLFFRILSLLAAIGLLILWLNRDEQPREIPALT